MTSKRSQPARILRWPVPVDGRPHTVPARIVGTACREADSVDVWAVEDPETDGLLGTVEVTVVGTGHDYPAHWQHLATVVAPGGTLVWHLMRVGAT